MVSERVEPFKQLSGGVEFVPHIPKAFGGRLLRKVIREKLLKEKGITSAPGMSGIAAKSKSERGFGSKDYGGRASLF